MNVGINNRASTINQIFVGVNNIARLVYQSGGGTPAFQLPEFTGNNAISGDELSGRIELYESGTLTLYPGTYDIFLVGGGSSGAGPNGFTKSYAGGCSGKTSTQSALVIEELKRVDCVVGAGGARTTETSGGGDNYNSGGTSSVNIGDMYEAAGGTLPNGGSGGGRAGSSGDGGAGASDGASASGTGQGTTTRMFGESSNTIYAGGGGGGAADGSGGSGGAGGGGTGCWYDTTSRNGEGTPGTANTGGGGGGGKKGGGKRLQGTAGGSGVIIVRWNNT